MFLVHDHESHSSIDHIYGSGMLEIGITVMDDIGAITVIGELDTSNSTQLHDYLQSATDTGLSTGPHLDRQSPPETGRTYAQNELGRPYPQSAG